MPVGDLTSLESVRRFLNMTDETQTDADDLLGVLITQASKAIHTHTAREFSSVETGSATRVFAYYGGGRLFMTPFDLRAATEVQIDTDSDNPTTLVEGTDYVLFPRSARNGVYEFLELRSCEPGAKSSGDVVKPWREVMVTGTWGFEEVPSDVVAACHMLVAFWFRQHTTTPGVSLEGEGDRYGPVSMPSAVLQILAPYRVIGFGYGA